MTRIRLVPLTIVRLAAVLAVLLLFAGCKKQEAATAAVAAPMHAPASQTDDAAWKAYFQDAISHNDDGVTDRTNAYYLPAPGGADYQGKYDRQLQGVVPRRFAAHRRTPASATPGSIGRAACCRWYFPR